MKTIQHCTLATLAGLWFVLPAQAAPRYRVTDLGSLSANGYSEAFDINEFGQVVGYGWPRGWAFLWNSTGGMQNLGVLPGAEFSTALGINNVGQVVGYSHTNIFFPFLWTGTGGMQILWGIGEANDINDLGQVVGIADLNFQNQAVLWTSAGGVQELGFLPDHHGSSAYGINNAGQVVGYSHGTSEGTRAFLWTNSAGMTNLGVLPGHGESVATQINNTGQVVGYSAIGCCPGSASRAFLWTSNGGMQDLGVLPGYTNSVALGINDAGQVVGSNRARDSAWVWTSTDGMKDLNTLMDPSGTDWALSHAHAINNAGQIVGYGRNPEGYDRGFLLTPIPGDFNLDGQWDCADVDSLVGVIASGTHDPGFDLTGDGSVDTNDLTQWLADAGGINLASGNSYFPADANLDGSVDGSDFGLWNANKFTSVAAWCSGDFTANGVVDGSDFSIWNANKFTSSAATSVVPEPMGAPLIVIAVGCMFASRRIFSTDPASVGKRLAATGHARIVNRSRSSSAGNRDRNGCGFHFGLGNASTAPISASGTPTSSHPRPRSAWCQNPAAGRT